MSRHTLRPLIWLARISVWYSVVAGTPVFRGAVPSFRSASMTPGTIIAGFFMRGCTERLQYRFLSRSRIAVYRIDT
jgi:hypothetical protein